MKRNIQHGLLDVQQFDVSQWQFPVHTHNHFELILIRSGKGHHFINGNRFPYHAGDVFFLGPLDSHYFSIDEQTRFCTLSFTGLYMTSLAGMGRNLWQQISERALCQSSSLVGSIVTDAVDQQNLNALVDIIRAEQANHCHLFSNAIVESLMRTILSLIDRQLSLHPLGIHSSKVVASSLTQRIGAYICHHITRPDYLRLEKIADAFNYSPSHLGALFKQQAGESIQQYIIRYKLQLVETRLRLSSMTVSQIADEFGFTDICHLNKLFKQRFQTTPTSYRRNLSASSWANKTSFQDSFC